LAYHRKNIETIEALQNKRFYGKISVSPFGPLVKVKRGRKTLYIKIKDGNPSIKSIRQMRARVDITQRKKKNKQ
jgi:hypothetical protein